MSENFVHIMEHSIQHAVTDSIRLLPFLFLTYLIMEYVEHKTSQKTGAVLQTAGKIGPVLGGIAGIIPQCGMSAAAANLYAGRMITLGTLLAIFLSTSDEMLPIMLSRSADMKLIGTILLWKAGIGMVAGFFVDFAVQFFSKK